MWNKVLSCKKEIFEKVNAILEFKGYIEPQIVIGGSTRCKFKKAEDFYPSACSLYETIFLSYDLKLKMDRRIAKFFGINENKFALGKAVLADEYSHLLLGKISNYKTCSALFPLPMFLEVNKNIDDSYSIKLRINKQDESPIVPILATSFFDISLSNKFLDHYSVFLRDSLISDRIFCYFYSYLTCSEEKNLINALKLESLKEAMQNLLQIKNNLLSLDKLLNKAKKGEKPNHDLNSLQRNLGRNLEDLIERAYTAIGYEVYSLNHLPKLSRLKKYTERDSLLIEQIPFELLDARNKLEEIFKNS